MKESKKKKSQKKSAKAEDEEMFNSELIIESKNECITEFDPYINNQNIIPDYPAHSLENGIIKASAGVINKIEGAIGHKTYYSKQTATKGLFYFEVEIVSLEYNILDYVNPRRIDEFSKKYYENILNNVKSYSTNIRIGFVSNTTDKDITIGSADCSYAYRASDGALINDGEYLEGNNKLQKGDIIGTCIYLKEPRPDFIKTLHESERNLECYIKYFVNGEEQTNSFIGLIESSYHAAVTLYNFAQASINFGPNFKYGDYVEQNNIEYFYDSSN